MQEGTKVYDKDMPVEEWTEGVFKRLTALTTGVWLLVALEAAKFLLW